MQFDIDMSQYIGGEESGSGGSVPPGDPSKAAAAKREAQLEDTKKFVNEYLKQQKKLNSNLEKIERLRAATQIKEKKLADRILLQDARIASRAANARGAQMIKAAGGGGSGGGGGSALAAGALGGGVAGGIMALVEVFRKFINQSKIATAVSDTISKLMGALIDYALLPFLPAIADGLTSFAEFVTAFGEGWGSFTTTLKEGGLAGLLSLTIDTIWKGLAGWVNNFMSWLFDGGSLTDKVIDIGLGILSNISVPWLPTEKIGEFFSFLLGSEKMKEAELALTIVKGAINSFVDAAWKLIVWLFGGEADKLKIDIALNLLEQGSKAAWGVVDTITSGVGGVISTLGGAAAGASAAVSNAGQQIVNIYGTLFKDENDMYTSVATKLRQDQYRYNSGST